MIDLTCEQIDLLLASPRTVVPVAKDFLHDLLDHFESLLAHAAATEYYLDRQMPESGRRLLLDSHERLSAGLYRLVFPDAPESQ